MNRNLLATSIEVILNNQSEWGSYVASPAFPTYQHCWLRDGSFIAHAMDVAGEHESAKKYFQWVGRVILRYQGKLGEIARKIEAGEPIGKDEVLHTRFSLDGQEVTEDDTWGNFQIDGYGTWLWALSEHGRLSGDASLLDELYESIQITLRYLELVWMVPNYDCWEEHPEYLHPYSLATVYAGFNSVAGLEKSGKLKAGRVPAAALAERVREFMACFAVENGRLVKHIQPSSGNTPPQPIYRSGVDASLIGVTLPFFVLPLDHPLMAATIKAIESDLHRPNGGVYRYKADVYYGGGEWCLLAAWLGWYHASIGNIEQAQSLLEWIETQADNAGFLAEQVSDHILAPDFLEPWQMKWGPVAKPLLWSHAMYIILQQAIEEHRTK